MAFFHRLRRQRPSELPCRPQAPPTGKLHQHRLFRNGLPAALLSALGCLIGISLVLHSQKGHSWWNYVQYQGHGETTEELGQKFTIRVNTFRRNDLLARFVQHFTRCPSVHSIQIVWSDQEHAPPSLASLGLKEGQGPQVLYERHAVDSLHNRFRPRLAVETPGVLSLDDDVLVSCAAADTAFQAWKRSPGALVGFSARVVHLNATAGGHTYSRKTADAVRQRRYHTVLTKNAFMHRRMLHAYERELSAELLKFVDDSRNCEDLAMQFVALKVSGGVPPLWVRAHLEDAGIGGGISAGTEHKDVRGECVDRLVREFGGLELPEVTHFASSLDHFVEDGAHMKGLLKLAEGLDDKLRDSVDEEARAMLADLRKQLRQSVYRWHWNLKPHEREALEFKATKAARRRRA